MVHCFTLCPLSGSSTLPRYIPPSMIHSSRRLAEFEARYGREAFRDMPYSAALELFGALWAEARALNPDFGVDWLDDLAADRAVARAVNGLPPAA